MKLIAITSESASGLSASMDPRFGRAPHFVLVDLDSGEVVDTLPNAAARAAHGAGTSAAALMAKKNVATVVAGRFGPKALQVLKAAGIELRTAEDGLTVAQALAKLQAGELPRA